MSQPADIFDPPAASSSGGRWPVIFWSALFVSSWITEWLCGASWVQP